MPGTGYTTVVKHIVETPCLALLENIVDGRTPELYWDSTYAICVALMEQYPHKSPIDVGLAELVELVIALPGFDDDPDMYTERILLDIQNVWYEESN